VDFLNNSSNIKSRYIKHFDFQKRAKGHVLLELVYQHLELIEKDYFGLQFSDNGMPLTAANSDAMVGHCFIKQYTPTACSEQYGRMSVSINGLPAVWISCETYRNH
jgi:hypothetical protein